MNELDMRFKIFCAVLSSGVYKDREDVVTVASNAYSDFCTAWSAAQPQEQRNEQPTPTNSAMLKCSCYSTSFCSEGNYYLVRNDCPVHKGTLQQ